MRRRHAEREQFRSKFQVTNVNLEAGTLEGMASVFGSLVDTYPPTIVERGAFAKTLSEQADRVKILWQHDPYCPIGLPTLLEESDRGLRLVAKISDTEMGADALTLVRDGVVTELSIGFDPIRWEMQPDPAKPTDQDAMIRHLKELRLWEISLVTFAADPMAKIMGVHARQPAPADYEWDEAGARARVAAWARFEPAASEGVARGSFLDQQAAVRYGSAFLLHNALEVARRGRGPLEFKHLVHDVIDGDLRLVPSALLTAAVALTRETYKDGMPGCGPMKPKSMMDAVAVLKALLDAETPPPADAPAPAATDARPPAPEARRALPVDTLLREMEMQHTASLAGVR